MRTQGSKVRIIVFLIVRAANEDRRRLSARALLPEIDRSPGQADSRSSIRRLCARGIRNCEIGERFVIRAGIVARVLLRFQKKIMVTASRSRI